MMAHREVAQIYHHARLGYLSNSPVVEQNIKIINTTCPCSGKPVTSSALTTYRGHVVGFCNPACRDKFNKARDHFDHAIPDSYHTLLRTGFTRLARYNRWMNKNLFTAVENLTEEEFNRDVGAFFRSILVTLNHILVWDTTWLQRFARHNISYSSLAPVLMHDTPTANDEKLHSDLKPLMQAREAMDELIIEFIIETKEADYASTFTFQRVSGEVFHKNFGAMIQHLFNHQTHHRGQVTTMLFQMGVDPGVTDLLATLAEETE